MNKHETSSERHSHNELKARANAWRPIIDFYRSQLGDKAFNEIVRIRPDVSAAGQMRKKLENIIERGGLEGSLATVLKQPTSKFLRNHNDDLVLSYVRMLSVYIEMHRQYRSMIRKYNTDITKLKNCSQNSVSEARRRVQILWSGYGHSPIEIYPCSEANPPNSYLSNSFYVSKSFCIKAEKFPDKIIDSAAPIGIEEIEESTDGFRSARAWVFKQHLRRGVDCSYKHSVSEAWIAYNPGMQISAMHYESRAAVLKLLKSRTLRAITKKIQGV